LHTGRIRMFVPEDRRGHSRERARAASGGCIPRIAAATGGRSLTSEPSCPRPAIALTIGVRNGSSRLMPPGHDSTKSLLSVTQVTVARPACGRTAPVLCGRVAHTATCDTDSAPAFRRGFFIPSRPAQSVGAGSASCSAITPMRTASYSSSPGKYWVRQRQLSPRPWRCCV
jgi:hypothetical protein